jgi:putative transposase
MTRPYSNDIRERALARVEKGEPIRSVAAALAVSPSCVSKWGARKRRTGGVAPGKIGGHKKRTLSGEIAEWLRARMRGSAFTLRGLVVELAERDVKTHARAVWVFAHAEGFSFKKNTGGLGADASGRRAEANTVEGPASQRRS